MRRLALPLLLLCACSEMDTGGLDASTRPDASAADAAPAQDTGAVVADSGVARDTGVAADTGVPADTGVVADSGVVADTGVARDTGVVAADSGVAGDGGPAPDAACVPSGPEVCNGRDDDCDGFADNVDVGDDGIYDCLRIGIFGGPGANASSDFQAWLQTNGTTVTRLFTSSSSTITPAILANLDVVILDRLPRDYTPAEAAVFTRWIEAGGGVVSMSGYSGGPADVTRPNSLLVEVGGAYGGALASGPVTRFNPHPLTTGIGSITFLGGFGVTAMPTVGTSTVVARLPDARPAGIAFERGRGRVFMWGDEWIEFDSEWRQMPQIAVFWGNILGWLAHFR